VPEAQDNASSRPLWVGLTGGIASGKSTVADLFAELGATIIDTDVIAREVVMPGEPALDEVREAFGDTVFDAEGALDRTALRALIFADDGARRKLEEILHPRIQQATLKQTQLAGGVYQIIVVPLLAESPLKSYVDRILVVDCDEDTQIRRLLARDTETEEQAKRILAAQSSREERLAIADDVINNDGDLADTSDQVAALHEIYLSLA
jgi:dephospho-CoA kinase